MIGMSYDHQSPQPPRSEPEILPPGQRDGRFRNPSAVWLHVDERDGVRRVVISHPGPTTIVLGLLFLVLIAGIAFLALAGFLLIWVPIVLAGILVAIGAVAIRNRLRLLRARWTDRT
jgi:hypothetical protein